MRIALPLLKMLHFINKMTCLCWIGAHDVLFLKDNNAKPMVLMPWTTWAKLIARQP